MINTYYQQQLAFLRELGADFGRKYPALAPMLAGQSADPDVERLLEGTAFLTGLVQERLDDDFPEFVHNLTELMFPHYLHPIPSSTIIRFSGSSELTTPQLVATGSELRSREVEGVSCIYTTIDNVTIYPLKVEKTLDDGDAYILDFSFLSGSLSEFSVSELRIFVSGDFRDSSDFIFDLATRLEYVEYSDGKTKTVLAPSEAVELLAPHELSVIPYHRKMFSAFRPVQEYFQLPEVFSFFRLKGLNRLHSTSREFSVRFAFDDSRKERSRNHSNVSFELYCVPAVNVFRYEVDTVKVDYHQNEYKINPRNGSDNFHVYSVDRVVGYVQGSVREKEYRPFECFNPQTEKIPVYSIRRRKSKLSDSTDVYISVAVPSEKEDFLPETLVLTVNCTNGSLADHLRLGDINQPTDKIPLFVEYTNITQPTYAVECPLGKNLLWRLLSHVYLNQNTISNLEALTSLLKLYIFVDTENKAQVQMNTKKVESIIKVEQEDTTRLISGVLARGKLITIHFSRDGFSSQGDMYIFANVIQRMMGAYTGINNFTIVHFCDLSTGKMFLCQKLQMGSRSIL